DDPEKNFGIHTFGGHPSETRKDTFRPYPHDSGGGPFPLCWNSDQQEFCCSPGGA
ncbi:hypothetical protein AMECASPLE_001271, partial [Ameca splendens]